MSETILQICTMKDPLCAQGVEKKLLALPGVHHAHTNAVNGTTTIHYDEKSVTLATSDKSPRLTKPAATVADKRTATTLEVPSPA